MSCLRKYFKWKHPKMKNYYTKKLAILQYIFRVPRTPYTETFISPPPPPPLPTQKPWIYILCCCQTLFCTVLCASIPGGSVASLAVDSKEAGKKDGASQMSIDVKSLEQQLSVDNVGTGSGADGTVSPRSQLGSASSELAKSYGFRPLSTCAYASVKLESDGFTILKSA